MPFDYHHLFFYNLSWILLWMEIVMNRLLLATVTGLLAFSYAPASAQVHCSATDPCDSGLMCCQMGFSTYCAKDCNADLEAGREFDFVEQSQNSQLLADIDALLKKYGLRNLSIEGIRLKAEPPINSTPTTMPQVITPLNASDRLTLCFECKGFLYKCKWVPC